MPRSLLPLVLVLAAFLLPALRPGPDADVFWHLRAGDDLIAGNPGTFQENWSYTADGSTWVNHEWLAEFFFAAARRAGGEAALILFTALITGLTGFLLWRAAEIRNPPTWVFAFFLCLAAAATSDRFVPRPQVFTYLCLALLMERLAAVRRGGSIWPLIAVQVFWTNVHGPLWGLFFAIPLLLGGAVPGMAVKRRLGLCVALLAASCVHPQGYRVLTDYLNLLGGSGLFHQTIREWLPLTDPKQEGLPQTNAVWGLILSGAAVLLAAIFSPGVWRRWGVMLCLAAVIVAPFVAIRNRDLLAMTLVPLAAMVWPEFPSAIRTPGRPIRILFGLGALIVTAIPLFGFSFPGPGFLRGSNRFDASLPPRLTLATRTFPVAAVDFLTRHAVGTRVFNAYDYGGFLVDRLRDRRVFMDGRYFVFGESTYLDYLLTRDGGPEALSLLDRTNTDLLMIRYPQKDGYQGLADVVLKQREWALVFWDDETLILVRRNAAPPAWLADHEYHRLIPTVPDWMQDRDYWITGRDELVAEAGRAAAEAPEALLPRILLGMTFEYNGRDKDAAAAYREALTLKPDHAPAIEGLKRIAVRLKEGPGRGTGLETEQENSGQR